MWPACQSSHFYIHFGIEVSFFSMNLIHCLLTIGYWTAAMKRLASFPYLGVLTLILAVKVVIMLWLILAGPIGLSPDEAQYWTWSQHLDYSYYSKPAAIAWEIGLGTRLFGNTELGVRSGALFLAFFLPLALYLLARCCQLRPQAAFYAALTLVLTPLGILSSILSITDTGMILFWILACAAITSGLARNATPNYWVTGACIGLGALFKWPIYLLWCFVIGYLPFERCLRSWRLAGGIVLSLLGLVPTIIWNSTHHWVAFRHVFYGIAGSDLAATSGDLFQGNSLSFLGAQFALVSPIIFILVIIACFLLFKKRPASPLIFCGLVSFLLLIFFSTLSLFKKVQGNWCDFAYPTAFVLLGWLASESERWRQWLSGALTLSMMLTFLALTIPLIQSHDLFPNRLIPYRYNPFRHNIGWDAITPQLLDAAGYDAGRHFLFSSSYQTASLLSFYGPSQKQAYFFNLHSIRHNQFSLWPGMEQREIGNDGYYVVIENHPSTFDPDTATRQLQPHFSNVTFLGSYPLFFSYGIPVKVMFLFDCRNYNGTSPPLSTRY